MAAIITDQFRILSAKNFVNDITSTENSFYSFVGLCNATDYKSDWDTNPPSPKDSFDEENDYWDTIIALKKINNDDVRQVIRKNTWVSGEIYDMYRHDISRTNLSKPSGKTSLYASRYYVVNSDYRVYICLFNGASPENNFNGNPSLDEPKFTDQEPQPAGSSGDGYIWKYLYTIKPSDIIKFDSINFIPVPRNWDTSTDAGIVEIRDNAETNGQLRIIVIKDRGSRVGDANRIYNNIPIKGDGQGATATIVIGNNAKVQSITVTNGGSGYTYGTVDLRAGNVPTGQPDPVFDVIIPPLGGHGYDVYRELGATNVLVYSRIENDLENPDFITGNQIARIGLIENPLSYDSSSLLTIPKASAVGALKLTGIGYSSTVFSPDQYVTQTVGTGITAVGRVVSYNQQTGVLKYWQDRSLVGFNTDKTQNPSPEYGFDLVGFATSISGSGSYTIVGGSSNLNIDTTFNGSSTNINNRNYSLGQEFVNGISTPEVKKHSGNIIYVDNRPSITRSINQKEDIKIVLQF
jgi:hypothetical protein